ncbi:MAG: hypothetical protein AB1640_23550 [bacterium]
MAHEKTAQIIKDPPGVDETAHPFEPVEWWYANALLDAPGSPIDGCALVGTFTIQRQMAEYCHGLIVSPEKGSLADFSGYELPPGTISSSQEELRVGCRKNYLRGRYPRWRLHLEGEDSGRLCRADLEYQAGVDADRRTYDIPPSYMHHYVVYRSRVRGAITLGKESWEVRGTGYYEHFFGFLNPLESSGWIWYWCPAAGPHRLAFNLGVSAFRGGRKPLSFVFLTEDGKTFADFTSASLEVLEERNLGGIVYPHKIRVTERSEQGKLDAVVTRMEAHYHRVNRSPLATSIFVTGFSLLEGRAAWMGRGYDLTGRAFGSVMRVELPETNP